MISKAIKIAHAAHKEQVRKYNGRPYIEHPARVAALAGMNSYFASGYCLEYTHEQLISAAWLHDVIEDCDPKYGDWISDMDPVLHSLVVGLTNTTKPTDGNRQFRKRLDRERLAVQPMEVRMLKMMDRLDNLQSVEQMPVGYAMQFLEESKLLVDAITRERFLDINLMHDLQEKIVVSQEYLEIQESL